MKRKSLVFFCIVMIGCMIMAVALADGWTCPDCGATNTGNFCSNCGAKKPESSGSDMICTPKIGPVTKLVKG